MFRKLLLTAMACALLAPGMLGCEKTTTKEDDKKPKPPVTTVKEPETKKAPDTAKQPEKKGSEKK